MDPKMVKNLKLNTWRGRERGGSEVERGRESAAKHAIRSTSTHLEGKGDVEVRLGAVVLKVRQAQGHALEELLEDRDEQAVQARVAEHVEPEERVAALDAALGQVVVDGRHARVVLALHVGQRRHVRGAGAEEGHHERHGHEAREEHGRDREEGALEGPLPPRVRDDHLSGEGVAGPGERERERKREAA